MSFEQHIIIDSFLLTIILALAIAVLRMRNLFSAIIIAGVFSMTMASLFVLLAAPDVAFTEAAVGAGLSTVLMLASMSVLDAREKPLPQISYLSLLMMFFTGLIIFYGTLDLPPHGSQQAASHLHVAPDYLERSLQDTSVPNVVTAVLASYRGFDTLGEVFVIFTAGIGVLALIGAATKRRDPS